MQLDAKCIHFAYTLHALRGDSMASCLHFASKRKLELYNMLV